MSYGLKMYNIYGNINLTDSNRTLRLHDFGESTVSGRSDWETPGALVVNITPIEYFPVLSWIDVDSSDWSVLTDTAIEQFFYNNSINADNQVVRFAFNNWGTGSRDLLWRVWRYK